MSDQRTFDEIVRDTIYDPKYEHIVSDVIRDKESGWRHRYYEAKGTCWDVSIVRTKEIIHVCEENIRKNEALLKNQEVALANSRLPPNSSNYKALSKRVKEEMDTTYVIATDSLREDRSTIKQQKPILEDLLWLQYTENWGRTVMHYLISNYKINNDIDYLRKGITHVWVYVDGLRHMSTHPPQPVEEREPSYSAW